MDPSKVKDVLDWLPPAIVSQIRSFLGLAGYYRRFIEGFSKIAKPMTELLKKDKKFEWTSDYEKSFTELKKRLTTAPVLTLRISTAALTYIATLPGKDLGVCLCKRAR